MELIRHVGIQLLSEPHIETRLKLIEQALNRFPNERFFKQSFAEIHQTLEKVRDMASTAHRTASEGQFEEALTILDAIARIYPEYPSIDADRKCIAALQEKDKLAKKKPRSVAAIRKTLSTMDVDGTFRLLQTAFEEFPNDSELIQLQDELTRLEKQTKEARSLYEVARQQVAAKEYETGIAMLRQANSLDSKAVASKWPCLTHWSNSQRTSLISNQNAPSSCSTKRHDSARSISRLRALRSTCPTGVEHSL
jgi:tetratricopeptide (TPR) repeat protein